MSLSESYIIFWAVSVVLSCSFRCVFFSACPVKQELQEDEDDIPLSQKLKLATSNGESSRQVTKGMKSGAAATDDYDDDDIPLSQKVKMSTVNFFSALDNLIKTAWHHARFHICLFIQFFLFVPGRIEYHCICCERNRGLFAISWHTNAFEYNTRQMNYNLNMKVNKWRSLKSIALSGEP